MMLLSKFNVPGVPTRRDVDVPDWSCCYALRVLGMCWVAQFGVLSRYALVTRVWCVEQECVKPYMVMVTRYCTSSKYIVIHNKQSTLS